MVGVATTDGVGAAVPALTGFTIAITCDRRSADLCAALQRHGAVVMKAATLRVVPLTDDTELIAATRSCISRPPDDVVVTTGIGLRGWIDAADATGIGSELSVVLGSARILTHGPKARGAVRAAGFAEAWSAPSESTEEVVSHLAREDLRGRRIALQLHGETLPEVTRALQAAGAEVVEVPVYRWAPAADPDAVRRLVDSLCRHQVDAVTFTSAPAAAGLLRAADAQDRLGELCSAFRGAVLAVAVGPVTAAPLRGAGIEPVEPHRARMGAMVRTVVDALPMRHNVELVAAGHRIEVRARAAVVDGTVVLPPPAAMGVLRSLAQIPGRIVTRDQLRAVLPGEDVDGHAVDVAVARLRSALRDPAIVATAVKRGYRLAVDV